MVALRTLDRLCLVLALAIALSTAFSFHRVDLADSCDPQAARRDCGFMGIDQSQCEAKGCCWTPVSPNPGNLPWCYYSNGPTPPGPPPPPPPSPPTPPPPTPPPPTPPSPPPSPPPGPPPPPPPSPPPGPPSPLPGCETFHENQCQGDQIITPASFENHRWYTPERSSSLWKPGFQDYSHVVGTPLVQYNAALTTATVYVKTLTRDQSVSVSFSFCFGSACTNTSNPFQFYGTGNATGPLQITVLTSDGKQIILEPVDFVWNNVPIKERAGDYRDGQKGAIVELFGWPHNDIAQECAFLASAGYLGVKVFPVMEQVMSEQPFQNVLNPWYFMYQPVSYKFSGRMGTRDELRRLIQTCRSQGVRVYADAVINHMVGGGNDANPYHRNQQGSSCNTWPNKNTSGGIDGSPMYTQDFAYLLGNYSGQPPSQEFPGAMYGPTDFHCERPLNSWTDPLDLNAGWLSGLVDLNTETDWVQERIAAYLTDIISIGFSGFRIDAAKHIQPPDLVAIFSKVRRNLGGQFPPDFISWLEVLLGGESDLLMCNPQSGYNYGITFEQQMLAAGISQTDVNKIKIWNSGYPKEPEKGCCTISQVRNAIQNDDHDQQTSGSTSRDMGDQGCVLVEGCAVDVHRGFEVKLFQSPNGVQDNDSDFPIRLVLSSFYWWNGSLGVPDGLSDCSLCTITCQGCQSVPKMEAFDSTSTGYNNPGYTRVHRDAAIIAAMRAWMHL
eukprot:m.246766 g.246766  ORF g.246766 m.246766 type:complete len:724 (+) comp15173_c0_seq1:482-2653(+)